MDIYTRPCVNNADKHYAEHTRIDRLGSCLGLAHLTIDGLGRQTAVISATNRQASMHA
jgi:hypothetical protein